MTMRGTTQSESVDNGPDIRSTNRIPAIQGYCNYNKVCGKGT